jgi:hypothetical protein
MISTPVDVSTGIATVFAEIFSTSFRSFSQAENPVMIKKRQAILKIEPGT